MPPLLVVHISQVVPALAVLIYCLKDRLRVVFPLVFISGETIKDLPLNQGEDWNTSSGEVPPAPLRFSVVQLDGKPGLTTRQQLGVKPKGWEVKLSEKGRVAAGHDVKKV
jgi:hypothetical protein